MKVLSRPVLLSLFSILMFVLALPATSQAGGPIVSGETLAGTLTGPDYRDTWTFSGEAGQRVVFRAARTTNGAPVRFRLEGPGIPENTAYREDLAGLLLSNSGTYSISILGYGPAPYDLTFINLAVGPMTSSQDPDGGPYLPGEARQAQFQSPSDIDCYTFEGQAGDRVELERQMPSGDRPSVSLPGQAINATSWSLQTSGTNTFYFYQAFNETGPYGFSLLNMTTGQTTSPSDLDGGILSSNEVRSASTSGIADIDVYTFEGLVGQRMVIHLSGGAGGEVGYRPAVSVRAPGNSPGGYYWQPTSHPDRFDLSIDRAGTWTMFVSDAQHQLSGNYALSYVNLTAGPHVDANDPDGGSLDSGAPRTGAISSPVDFDVYTFPAVHGEHLLIGAATTTGAMSTNIMLYPPGGSSAVVNTTAGRFDFWPPLSGTWTMVIEGRGADPVGNYSASMLNLTSGPLTNPSDLDGGAIESNQLRAASIGLPADFDAYTFNALAGARVTIAAQATSGEPRNLRLSLYPPGGRAKLASNADGRLEAQLTESGTWTITAEDEALANVGDYSLNFVDVTAGPVSSVDDPDGGDILPGQTRNGNIVIGSDLDVYWFTGDAGQIATIQAPPLAGTNQSRLSLYAPGGGPALLSSDSYAIVYRLTSSGQHAILVEDVGNDSPGSYALSLSLVDGAVGVDEGPVSSFDPVHVVFAAARPNPSRGRAQLTFSLPRDLDVELQVFDIRGARVRQLATGTLSAGPHVRDWDGRTDQGMPVGPGMYFAELRAGREVLRQRLVRLE